MGKYPLYTRVIKLCQPLILQQILEIGGKPVMLSDSNAIKQHIKNRKQHNTCEIRHHQSGSNGKGLIHENGTGNSTHKNQRYEDSNSGQ